MLKVFFDIIEQNGLSVLDVGNSYMADHAQANGNVAESALDHAYVSLDKVNQPKLQKIKTVHQTTSQLF